MAATAGSEHLAHRGGHLLPLLPKPRCGRGAGVLVATHDSLMRSYLVGCLADAGYRVRQARSGLEGWCAFELDPPHLVVLDLDMPAISGFRLLRLLRTGGLGETPVMVVVLSASDLGAMPDESAIGRVVAHRGEAYLRKPVDGETLLECMDALLQARARAR